jgi:hypothetical protein
VPSPPRLLRALIAAAVALAATMLSASARSAPPTPADFLRGGLHVGLQDDQLAIADLATIEARLDRLASTGVRVTRVDVLWADIAPSRPGSPADPNDPAYDWTRLDRIVDGLASRDIAAIFALTHTPRWANGGQSWRYAPSDLDDYAAFVAALARRYDGVTADALGSVHARVAMLEPWNEPNVTYFLRPQWEGSPGAYRPASPRIYAGMLSRAYSAWKAVQPDSLVIGISGSPDGKSLPPDGPVGIVDFVRGVAAYGPPVDAVSQHIYPAQAPSESRAMPSFLTLPELMTHFDAIKPGVPVLVSEFGYTTGPSPVRRSEFTEAEQAAYLPDAIAIMATMPRVRMAIWFQLQDNPVWPGGLLRADWSEKPSWRVFLAQPKLLNGPPLGVGQGDGVTASRRPAGAGRGGAAEAAAVAVSGSARLLPGSRLRVSLRFNRRVRRLLVRLERRAGRRWVALVQKRVSGRRATLTVSVAGLRRPVVRLAFRYWGRRVTTAPLTLLDGGRPITIRAVVPAARRAACRLARPGCAAPARRTAPVARRGAVGPHRISEYAPVP